MTINSRIHALTSISLTVILLLSLCVLSNSKGNYYLLPLRMAMAAQEGPVSEIMKENTTELSGFMYYKDANLGISLKYPSDWIPSTSGLVDYTDLIAFYPPLENLSDTFPPRFKLSVVTYSQNISLSEYTNFVSMILNQSQHVEVRNSSEYSISGFPSHRVIITEKPFQNGTLLMNNMNIWTTVGNRVYLMTYDGEETKFNKHMPEVEKILESIRITK